jgi:hypothetical protein
MKTFSTKNITLIILITAASISGYLYSINQKPNDGFFCTTDVNFYENNKKLSSSINFHMENGRGFLTLNGDYFINEHKITSVSLLKEFSYLEVDGEYSLSQINNGVLEVSEDDRRILSEFIPLFYLTKDIKTHHIRIKSIRKGVWIFTTAPVPNFVCTDY